MKQIEKEEKKKKNFYFNHLLTIIILLALSVLITMKDLPDLFITFLLCIIVFISFAWFDSRFDDLKDEIVEQMKEELRKTKEGEEDPGKKKE